MRTTRAPRRFRRSGGRHDVQAVVDEAIALFHWLEWVADQIYADEARGVARRWTLRRLHRYGPLTVPQLARARSMKRQSVQPVVDGLVAERLVEMLPNPAHARSKLAALTRRGIDVVERMDEIDARVLRAVGRGLPREDLATTAATLRALRAGFEAETRWRTVLGDASGTDDSRR